MTPGATHLGPIVDFNLPADGDACLRIKTGVPGCPVERDEIGEGVIVERNSAGSVVAVVFPRGVAGIEIDSWED
ncbi:hypothetical protein [Catelliglobosispora koreensis]|uniref:hypothetical protein n=1 Tax=Catelliglobosispora koreensis TaxID=129052 RepID=UPI00035C6DB8|nr:hypothetical protein [Catelliglobosispora koreensis]